MKTLVFLWCLIMTIGCSQPKKPTDDPKSLEAKTKRFAPVEITADGSKLSPGDRQALDKIMEASRLMDKIYIRQVWEGNEALKTKLGADTSPQGRRLYTYFTIDMSPWSSLDHNEPFVEGVPNPRPAGANYYPDDMTKEEFAAWVDKLSAEEQAKAKGFFYTIRRDGNDKLMTVPYAEEYRGLLEPAANLLREAAGLTDNPSLKRFLSLRADAFSTNDYYESDVAWMDLDSPIDVTIGPYEVYMDELFNYKAAFESYVTLRNDAETDKLAMFSKQLQMLEDNLPIEPRYRNPKLGASAPIRVVDVVLVGGEARAGVQTAAFNLPNDEKVTREKGSKRVMLKNVQEAKFKKILQPISRLAIAENQRGAISFEPFFTHILAHELMHGLGPHTITVNGKKTTVRQEMKELSSALEEAKADISGLWSLQFLIDKGVLSKDIEEQLYVTFLAGMFRSVRFGINEAHGKGVSLQFNYLMDEGAFVYDEAAEVFSVDIAKIKEAARTLSGIIMTIQAEGSYKKADELFAKYAVIREPMKKVLEKVSDIPVDIAPHFPLAGKE